MRKNTCDLGAVPGNDRNLGPYRNRTRGRRYFSTSDQAKGRSEGTARGPARLFFIEITVYIFCVNTLYHDTSGLVLEKRRENRTEGRSDRNAQVT